MYLLHRHLNNHRVSQKGLALPATLFIALISVTFVLLFSRMAMEISRSTTTLVKSKQGKAIADGGIQLGLASLSYRVSLIQDRIEQGYPDQDNPGLTRFVNIEQIRQYHEEEEPGKFWEDLLYMDDVTIPNLPEGETEFTTEDDGKVAKYEITNSSHFVTVRLLYANSTDTDPGVGNVFDQVTGGGYNNVWYRYSYEIISTDMHTGKSTRPWPNPVSLQHFRRIQCPAARGCRYRRV